MFRLVLRLALALCFSIIIGIYDKNVLIIGVILYVLGAVDFALYDWEADTNEK